MFGAMLRQSRKSAEMSLELLAEHAGVILRGVRVLDRGGRGAPKQARTPDIKETRRVQY